MMEVFNRLLSEEWARELGFPFLSSQYFNRLGNAINKEYAGGICYPPREDIFRMFKRLSPSDAQIILLGQDPYHEKFQATGVAFGIPEKQLVIPPSLKIIEREIRRSVYNGDIAYSMDYTMENWINQKIFLLNTALTVREGEAGSHSSMWDEFTKASINILNNHPGKIFLLWGKHAQSYSYLINSRLHIVLTAPHPAAEAYRSGAGYIGCNHFVKVNEILEANNGKEFTIKW